ncbi:hypothetical protein F1721_07540 [Saccharopolyspora hirsuta]|uniref:Uncharacterized protein n=1 Tax=Saccharopolyspora hirsuta TaxID=1837 RepID=A0A5M7C928_SACHI|nr:hypothetical protein [Saccharopolyspora hirsuta]KAA5836174.1 hypothetical protein F1721_07540 [Saccharopolyspora hirsuta]
MNEMRDHAAANERQTRAVSGARAIDTIAAGYTDDRPAEPSEAEQVEHLKSVDNLNPVTRMTLGYLINRSN